MVLKFKLHVELFIARQLSRVRSMVNYMPQKVNIVLISVAASYMNS